MSTGRRDDGDGQSFSRQGGEADPTPTMIRRVLETRLRSLAREYPVVTVTGPRQSGKSTRVPFCCNTVVVDTSGGAFGATLPRSHS